MDNAKERPLTLTPSHPMGEGMRGGDAPQTRRRGRLRYVLLALLAVPALAGAATANIDATAKPPVATEMGSHYTLCKGLLGEATRNWPLG